MFKPIQIFFILLFGLTLLMGLTVTNEVSAKTQTNTIMNDNNNFGLVIPIYNDRGLKEVKTTLKGQIRQGDTFFVVTGNFNKLNIDWANKAVKTLRQEFPGIDIVVGVGGLSNLVKIVENIEEPIAGIVYIYEPNLPEGPEFDWKFNVTTTNFEKVAEIAHSKGLRFIGKPSGRPILQRALQKYNWDYSQLGNIADHLFIQTQTYAKKGTNEYENVLDIILEQYSEVGKQVNAFPQVSIDPKAPNGVDVNRAIQCTRIAANKDFAGMLVWWSPEYSNAMFNYLQKMGR